MQNFFVLTIKTMKLIGITFQNEFHCFIVYGYLRTLFTYYTLNLLISSVSFSANSACNCVT